MFVFKPCFIFFFKKIMPQPGYEPGILRPQRRVLTTRPPKRFTFLKFFFLQCCSFFFFHCFAKEPFLWTAQTSLFPKRRFSILIGLFVPVHHASFAYVTFQPITDLPPAFCFLISPFLMGPVSKGRDPVICIKFGPIRGRSSSPPPIPHYYYRFYPNLLNRHKEIYCNFSGH